MSVANGRALLAMPGPTNVPDRVLQAMIRPAEELSSTTIVDLTESLLDDLKAIFRTTGETFLYAANGHGGWEAALTNVLARGDKILVLASGRFAVGWGETARFMGAEVEVLAGSWRAAVDPAAVEERLRQDTGHEIKAVLTVQIDTASGVVNDIPAIRRAIDAAGHPALYMVDGVASIGCMPFEMDAWGVDVAMSASQKGLMTPPGLAFVAANGKALHAHQRATMRTPYWDWTARLNPLLYMKHCGTPPEHLMFGLRAALDMILTESLDAVWERHALLASATHAAMSKWAEGQVLSYNVVEPSQRALSVTTILVDGDPAAITDYARQVCGVTLGIAIGDLSGRAFRIAHMGHVNAPMVLGSLSAVEMALQAKGIPHGSGGVAAAIAYLGAHAREVAA
ncbi:MULTISPECIES: aminotransferase class V-fold PLP-dependent enzyme [unclassified Bosea (in: a-proteobacteria)]|uniref:pyridoxal-phosphate-dependent aminotransferase family protein n=1 Tax=unclassified Bosea (in: a-proteobacteria) TaxID=2653178 RepID=UPI000F750F51|nr:MULTISPECIES: aminotransferase class V-fold PLP-dependent enzyme [unclassified Bosea (in: a-proteobacteria)]AZO78925.1 aminotransferase [Bosea sp. Tri-49]RXT27688.1 aminotransferase [Bosea sp. Tri-39]RXT35607.1 aminotransferase [Bosea sp. Tri-54]